jgi:hypothetical protein
MNWNTFHRSDRVVAGDFMNKQTLPESNSGHNLLLELGFALGQSHTFGLVAGRCSAAQAYGIRRLREEKLFKECCERWEDFCPNYLNMSRAEADRIIKHLTEFGPAYFEVSQIARISPETFRAIAPAVSDGVLHHNGEAIPLNAENSRKVAAAVAEMRSAIPKKPAASSEPPQDLQQRIHGLADRCVAILAELTRSSSDDYPGITRNWLYHELTRLRDEILRVAA